MMQKMKPLTFAKKPFMRFQADDLRDRCNGSERQLKSLKSSVSASLLIIESCVKVLLIFFFHLSPFFQFSFHPFTQRFTPLLATLFNDLLFLLQFFLFPVKVTPLVCRQLEDTSWTNSKQMLLMCFKILDGSTLALWLITCYAGLCLK